MRKIAWFAVLALVVAACSSGSGDAVTDDGGAVPGSGSAVADNGGAAPGSGGVGFGGGGFCDEARKIVAEVEAMDTENMEIGEIYGVMADVYGRLLAKAPADLKPDLEVVIDGARRLDEQFKAGEALSLTDAEQQAFDEASGRIDAYMTNECGISGDEDASGDGVDVVVGSDAPSTGGDQNQATMTVTAGGETYTEDLSGEMAVSCDMYGPLEDGSIGVYLTGSDFEATVSSNDTGVTPGTYDGLIWVFASNPDLDELVWGLQEYDGPFVLDEAYEVVPGMWFFSGSFSLTASDEWPEASIEATFACIGPVGY